MNTITEEQAEAYRREGDKRTVERVTELIRQLEDGCPPGVDCSEMHNCNNCLMAYLVYPTGDSQ